MEAYRSGHNEAVLKTVRVQAHGGSNPSASAKTPLKLSFKGVLMLRIVFDLNIPKCQIRII